MTYKELSMMNAHEKAARRLVKNIANEWIGGYLNTLMDYTPDDEEWQTADRVLSNEEDLKQSIYLDVMSSDKGMMKHIRFAGEEFIRKMIDREVATIAEERAGLGI